MGSTGRESLAERPIERLPTMLASYPLSEVERLHIMKVLGRTNEKEATRLLGIPS